MSMMLQLKVTLPLMELVNCLAACQALGKNSQAETTRAAKDVEEEPAAARQPPPPPASERIEAQEPRQPQKQWGWEDPIYEMQPTYASYAKKPEHKWQQSDFQDHGEAGLHILTLDEEFRTATFAPLPLPKYMGITHANYKEADDSSADPAFDSARVRSLMAETTLGSTPLALETGSDEGLREEPEVGDGFNTPRKAKSYPFECPHQ